MSDDGVSENANGSPRWRAGLLTLAFYVACLAVATYPMVFSLHKALPWGGADPLQHLTVMRQYKANLLMGRSPFVLPELQHPVGAPLANFSPLLLQSLVFVPLSCVISNDVLCYNLVWLFGLLTTGMGTYALASRMVGDRACAAFAGMLAMLSGPVLLHAHGHLELIHIGTFSVFLLGWIRFLDRPTPGRLAGAVAAYLVMVMGAAYFAVLGAIPGAWYFACRALDARKGGQFATWLRARTGWLVGFAVAAAAGSCVLFAAQLWGVAHGLTMSRSFAHFTTFGATLWSYALPTGLHTLHGSYGIPDFYGATGHPAVECCSYLGVVALGLIGYAAICKVGPSRPAAWWSMLAMLVVLSLGAYTTLDGVQIPMPSLWLWNHVSVFRSLRAPARFNLFAVVVAAVVAAAGLRHLLARIPGARARALTWATLAIVAVADLAMIPFTPWSVPAMPACYAEILRKDPDATFLEAPAEPSDSGSVSNAAWGYWQLLHAGRTSGGYSGIANAAFDDRLVHNSPFSASAMAAPGYLDAPDDARFGIVGHVGFRDYAWLALTAHDLRYVVVHQDPALIGPLPPGLGRLKDQLAPAKVFEDASAAVYDRSLLSPPAHPTLVCLSGWRGGHPGRPRLVAERSATLAAFNPDPDRPVTFAFTASAFRKPRTVRLLDGDAELARWTVAPGAPQRLQTPPLRLPAGLRHLALESDGEERPRHRHQQAAEGDTHRYSLTVADVGFEPDASGATPAVASKPDTEARR